MVVIPCVWAMRRKRDLTTNEITKHKARLNIHGGKQVYGINYYDTYAPVITWFAIRLLMAFAIMFELAMRQVDFIQAYPQAPIEFDMYMELPLGIETKTGNSKDHILQLLSNLYGQKQAGRVWNQYLVDKLRNIGFEPSLIDECVFYKDDIIFIVYVDDGIFFGGDDMRITQVIKDLKDQDLEVEDQVLTVTLNLPSELSLTISLMTQVFKMPTLNQSRLRRHRYYMPIKTLPSSKTVTSTSNIAP